MQFLKKKNAHQELPMHISEPESACQNIEELDLFNDFYQLPAF